MNLPSRLHHHAWVTRDQEANRRFFEDLLGMPLIATWCERTFSDVAGRELEYCHAFYGLADGSAIAFFQFADPADYEVFRAPQPKQPGYPHIALKVDRETFDGVRARLDAAGVAHRVTDHGYCLSLYVATPDELKVELTLDPPNAAAIAALRRADAHAALERWLAGDRTPNNTGHETLSK